MRGFFLAFSTQSWHTRCMSRFRKTELTDAFGNVLMDGKAVTALYIDPNTGERQKVQVPGTPLQKGYLYFSQYQRQFLFSEEDETVQLRYVRGRPSSGGSSGVGASGYLSPKNTVRKKKEPDELEKIRAKPEPFTGYRILINTADYSPTFNQNSGVYDVSEYGRLTSPDVPRKLKNVTVRSIKDIVDLMRFGNREFLEKSVVIFQNNEIGWEQFCIRMDTPSTQLKLLKRLQQHSAGTEPVFALVEIHVKGRHDPTPVWNKKDPNKRRKVPPVPLDPITIKTEEEGKKVTIQYSVYIDDQRADKNAKYSIYEAGSYFVLAEVRYNPPRSEYGGVHYLNLKVTHEDQIMRVNIENIDRDSKMLPREKLAQRKAEKPGPITLPKDWDPGPLRD